jgi:hypothetical protein
MSNITSALNVHVMPESSNDDENQKKVRICRSQDGDEENICEGSDDFENPQAISPPSHDATRADDTQSQ